MKKLLLLLAAAAMIITTYSAPVEAQCSDCGSSYSSCSGVGGDGMVQPSFKFKRVYHPARTLKMASHDHYSPHRIYAYSKHGIDASWTHSWNNEQMQNRAWHGNYNYWRWGAPTALVVPPTSAFQTSYSWGVGQTRSLPINHQFGRRDAGMIGGGGGEAFGTTPYWPSSTEEFGVYPVRGPWE